MLLIPPVALKLGSTGWRFVRYYLRKASFVVWLVATGIHVLAYLRRLPKLATADWRRGASTVDGSFARRLLLAVVLVAGAILAAATVRYAQPWTHFHGGGG